MSASIARSATLDSRVGRSAYLATLALLQAALLHDVAPRLAAALARDLRAGAGAPWALHAAGYALTLVGTAIALAFPALALARHVQRGRCRFRGLPRPGVGAALAGALLYATAQTLVIAAHFAPTSLDASAALAAHSLAAGGVAFMAAGVIGAEVLRRSIAPVRVPIAPWHCAPVRIEVIDPPELATRGI